MNSDQIVGTALSITAAVWLMLCVFGEVDDLTGSLRKFGAGMLHALDRIWSKALGVKTHREAHQILPGAAEAAWDAEVDLLVKATRTGAQEAIDRIQRELNRIEWERGTMQGERAPVLARPDPEVYLDDGVLRYVSTDVPVDLTGTP